MNVDIITAPDALQIIVDKYESKVNAMSPEEQKEHKAQFKKTGNPYQHLKTALLDWRVEEQWGKEGAVVAGINNTTFIFVSFTKTEPRHVTIRHVMSIPGAQKGQASYLVKDWLVQEAEQRNVERLRFFADKKAVGFYEKLGFTWHGISKTGLPFYYGTVKGELIDLPNAQQRFVVREPVVSQAEQNGLISFD